MKEGLGASGARAADCEGAEDCALGAVLVAGTLSFECDPREPEDFELDGRASTKLGAVKEIKAKAEKTSAMRFKDLDEMFISVPSKQEYYNTYLRNYKGFTPFYFACS
jgi:hypothetical protein